MKAFRVESGRVAPLDRANVDTDQIIPKQFLKSIRRTGFGDHLFDAWRFQDEGDVGVRLADRRPNPDFFLNLPRYSGAAILLARDNFGCGSSREHAVWALLEYGIRAVIAPGFADIFFNNCFKNGLLPVVLEENEVDRLFDLVESNEGFELTVDLSRQCIGFPGGETLAFEIDPMRKQKMLEGLDDIGLTLAHSAEIRDFERAYYGRRSWLDQ
ncbi:MAG: 3-isopropylmalate dehydratase small subunit [Gammaproteobacteria bacterium]|nr:3-isopropylmalate dehydratase small subunit [Gammaproteobacteria bacterium]